MPRKKTSRKRKVENYTHDKQERLNNPPVGLVTPDTDRDELDKTYAYDPHLDPELQWAGKAEHTSFDVPTVSLHVHERKGRVIKGLPSQCQYMMILGLGVILGVTCGN